MNDLRSPVDDRPYRTSERGNARHHDDDVMSTAEYYRSYFDAIRQSRWFPLASVCAAVLVFSGIVSYAYKQGSQSGVNATTPVVEATNTAYKEKPANPGGMDVPFQDAIVFDQLQNQDSANAGETIESLLPPPEQPVANELAQAPQQPANAEKAANVEKTAETIETAAATASATAESKAAEVVEPVTPQPTEALLQQAAPEAAPKEVNTIPTTTAQVETPKAVVAAPVVPAIPAAPKVAQDVAKKLDQVAPAAPKPATAAIASGSYRVQLGAFRDEAAARAAWKTFQNQYGAQLSGVTPDFPRADLGAKGVFYRVHGKNLSKASADSICSAINSQRSGSCMVTQ